MKRSCATDVALKIGPTMRRRNASIIYLRRLEAKSLKKQFLVGTIKDAV
jgi:hypothetical protein